MSTKIVAGAFALLLTSFAAVGAFASQGGGTFKDPFSGGVLSADTTPAETATATATDTEAATETATATDTADATDTPEAIDTPEATDTPEPTDTPTLDVTPEAEHDGDDGACGDHEGDDDDAPDAGAHRHGRSGRHALRPAVQRRRSWRRRRRPGRTRE